MDSAVVLMNVQDKLPKDDLMALNDLKQKLDSLDEKQLSNVVSKIEALDLKSPTLVFWVGSFFFGQLGAGRFMIGDVWLGVIRAVLATLYSIFYMANEEKIAAVFGLINLVWWVVDLFLVGKKLRKQNLQKILMILQ